MLMHGLYLNNKIFNFFVIRCVDACTMYHLSIISGIRNLNYLTGGSFGNCTGTCPYRYELKLSPLVTNGLSHPYQMDGYILHF